MIFLVLLFLNQSCASLMIVNAPPKRDWKTYNQQYFSNCTNTYQYTFTDAVIGVSLLSLFITPPHFFGFFGLPYIVSSVVGSENVKDCIEFNFDRSRYSLDGRRDMDDLSRSEMRDRLEENQDDYLD